MSNTKSNNKSRRNPAANRLALGIHVTHIQWTKAVVAVVLTGFSLHTCAHSLFAHFANPTYPKHTLQWVWRSATAVPWHYYFLVLYYVITALRYFTASFSTDLLLSRTSNGSNHSRHRVVLLSSIDLVLTTLLMFLLCVAAQAIALDYFIHTATAMLMLVTFDGLVAILSLISAGLIAVVSGELPPVPLKNYRIWQLRWFIIDVGEAVAWIVMIYALQDANLLAECISAAALVLLLLLDFIFNHDFWVELGAAPVRELPDPGTA